LIGRCDGITCWYPDIPSLGRRGRRRGGVVARRARRERDREQDGEKPKHALTNVFQRYGLLYEKNRDLSSKIAVRIYAALHDALRNNPLQCTRRVTVGLLAHARIVDPPARLPDRSVARRMPWAGYHALTAAVPHRIRTCFPRVRRRDMKLS
jgi:hypothetical protein